MSVPTSAFELQPRKEGVIYHQAGHYTQDLLLLKETEGTKIALVNK